MDQQANIDRLVFSVKVGKSYKNRGWSIIRDSTYELIPKLEYEDECDIIVDGIPTKAKFNILPRIFYDSSNNTLISHLKELNEIDPNKRVDVEFLLNNEVNKQDDELKKLVSELTKIIDNKDDEIAMLNETIKEKENEISALIKVIEDENK